MSKKFKATSLSLTKIRFLATVTFLLLFIVFAFYSLNQAENQIKTRKVINSFVECENAGNIMMESYPRRCTTGDGKTFIEELSEQQKQHLSPLPENSLIDKCGDNICQSVACLAIGCPKPETKLSCPQDCK